MDHHNLKSDYETKKETESKVENEEVDDLISKSNSCLLNFFKTNKVNSQFISDVSNIVNNIAIAVDSLPGGDSDSIDDLLLDVKHNQKPLMKGDDTTTIIADDILSTPIAHIVSQIKIEDESYDYNESHYYDLKQIDENKIEASTFEMTEVSNSKQANIDTDYDKKNLTTFSKCDESIINDTDDFDIQFTDDQLSQAYEEFKIKNILPSYLMRDPLLEYARRISLQFIIDEDYDKAKENDKHVNNLIKLYKDDGYNNFYDNYLSIENWSNLKTNLESRLEVAKNQQKENNRKFIERSLELKKDQERKLFELDRLHEEERQKFIESCSSSSFLHRFSKPSSHLLQLRHLQKQLAIQHNFNEAKKIKIEADKLQLKETKEARLKASDCVRKLYKMIIERQMMQKQCVIDNTIRKTTALEENFNRQNNANKNLTNQLEMRINEMTIKINSNPSLSKVSTFSARQFAPLNSSSPCNIKSKYLKSGNTAPSTSSTLPPLNTNPFRSSVLSNNLKRKREMISQAQKVSKLDVRLNGVQNIFVNVRKKPHPVHKSLF